MASCLVNFPSAASVQPAFSSASTTFHGMLSPWGYGLGDFPVWRYALVDC